MAVLAGTLPAQVPQLLKYQGRVAVGTPAVNFEGSGQFRFALVDAAGTTSYWSNSADTSPPDGMPDAAVSLTVTKGLYSVLLGDTTLSNMSTIPPSVWANADVRLRVWFGDGPHGFQLLTPDQRIAAVGYALMAETVKDGAITAAQIAAGAVGTAQLADLSITGEKLRLGTETGTAVDGTINYAPGAFTFTGTFDYPFSAAPAVRLLSPGWTLGPMTATGFTANIPTYLAFVPQTLDSTNGDLKYVRATNAAGNPKEENRTADER